MNLVQAALSCILGLTFLGATAAAAMPSFQVLGHDDPWPSRPAGIPDQAQDWTPEGQFAAGTYCCEVHGPGSRAAFRWSESGGSELIIPGVYDTGARGISDDGSVVVGFGFFGNGSYHSPFRWELGLGYEVLEVPGDPSGGADALGVSSDGELLVGYSNSITPGKCDSSPGQACIAEAFLWSAADGFRGLGDLDGGRFFSLAKATSLDGSVVVGSATNEEDRIPFIWSPEAGMRELGVVLESLGVDLLGYRLAAATYVSDDGLTISGRATSPTGETETFIATIPEPSTALLIGLGLTVLGVQRRRPGGVRR